MKPRIPSGLPRRIFDQVRRGATTQSAVRKRLGIAANRLSDDPRRNRVGPTLEELVRKGVIQVDRTTKPLQYRVPLTDSEVEALFA